MARRYPSNMTTLIHCIYASTATPKFAEHQLPKLLEGSRRKNADLGVTGMLLFLEGSFFQVLEGESSVVAALYSIIAVDDRHARVTQIIREPIPRRAFGEWTMGFSTLGFREAAEIVGENDFFKQAYCLERLGSGRAKKLLRAFRDGSWRTDQTGMHVTPGRVA